MSAATPIPTPDPPSTVRTPRSVPWSDPRTWALGAFGLLTASPVLVLVDPGQLGGYGLTTVDGTTLALLRHRGVLQLLLGGSLVLAALRPDLRRPIAGTVVLAKASFLALALASPEARGSVSPVSVVFDGVAVAVLLAVMVRPGRGRRARG